MPTVSPIKVGAKNNLTTWAGTVVGDSILCGCVKRYPRVSSKKYSTICLMCSRNDFLYPHNKLVNSFDSNTKLHNGVAEPQNFDPALIIFPAISVCIPTYVKLGIYFVFVFVLFISFCFCFSFIVCLFFHNDGSDLIFFLIIERVRMCDFQN
eukprot:Rmarinus@m.19789